MEGSLPSFQRAVKLDPLSAVVIFNLAETHMLLRHYDEANRLLTRSAQLSPDWPDPALRNARMHAEQLDDPAAARRLYAPYANVPASETQSSPTFIGAFIEYMGRQPDAALAILLRSNEAAFENQFYYRPRTLMIAQMHAFKADAQRARMYYDSALVVLDGMLRSAPDDPRLHAARGITLAGLGRKADAIQAGVRATQLLPIAKEAWRGAFLLQELARIYAATGETASAVDILAQLLKVPSELNATFLKNDPAWDSLRGDARFQTLTRS
jgi:tetratricopeptide (TPR) repeat protein